MKGSAVVLCLLGLAIPFLCAAVSQPFDDFPAKSTGDVSFTVDVVRYREPENKTLVQVFYELPYGQLQLGKKEGDQYIVEFEVHVEVKSLTTGLKKEHSWVSSGRVESKERALKEKGVGLDQFEVELASGTYELKVVITDVNSKKKGSAIGRVELSDLGSVLTLSDLHLATSIGIDTTGADFTRGNVKAVPNPNRLFGDNLPFVYAHLEIYNMGYDTANPGQYTTTYSVLDDQGAEVTTLPSGETTKLGRTGVEIGVVSVLGLKPGRYVLQAEVSDSGTEQTARALSSFQVARLTPRRPPMDSWAEEYFERIDLLVGEDSLRFMKTLSPEGQENFLRDFWLRRDPTPGTHRNEFFNLFALRIKEADEKYSSGLEDGLRSDRGRIWVRYGKPDDKEEYPADIDYPAHEDWLYYTEGGMQFIFSDITGIGKYELIYSSEETENTDPNWNRYIDSSFIRKFR